MNDEDKKLLLLERVRDFEIRKRTDKNLISKAITLGGYEKGLGFHIGEIIALSKEMDEDGLIRLSKGYIGGDEAQKRRRVETTSYGRQFLDLTEESEIHRVKQIHSVERARGSNANQSVSTHGKTVILTSAGLLDSVANFREKLRGENYLKSEHEAHYIELVEFLDWLYPAIQELILSVPNETPGRALTSEDEVKSWMQQYWPKAKEEFQKYTSPESVAKTTMPAIVVLSASSLGLLLGAGSLLGAAAGATAGAYVGNTLIGHAKPKEIGEKIVSAIEKDNQANE